VPALCLHWKQHTHDSGGIASVVDAVMDAVQCQWEERAVVVIDSALNAGLVSRRQLEQAFEHAPRRYARALGRADARSQSGIETLVRLRLRARGIRVSVQVRISGVGHVDLLIGDRFVIECDSNRWQRDHLWPRRSRSGKTASRRTKTHGEDGFS
jgi:hypothetical protein